MQRGIERRKALCALLGAAGGLLLASGRGGEAAQMPDVEARAENDRVLLQQIAETVDFAAEQQAVVLTQEERKKKINQIYQSLMELRRQSRR